MTCRGFGGRVARAGRLVLVATVAAAGALAQTEAPPKWHDATQASERIEECPVRLEVPIAASLLGGKKTVTEVVTIQARAYCEGAHITALQVTHPRQPAVHNSLNVKPRVELRKGRDKLAILLFELRQGDKGLASKELVMEIEEGKLNRGRAAVLELARKVQLAPDLVLRVRMEVEDDTD